MPDLRTSFARRGKQTAHSAGAHTPGASVKGLVPDIVHQREKVSLRAKCPGFDLRVCVQAHPFSRDLLNADVRPHNSRNIVIRTASGLGERCTLVCEDVPSLGKGERRVRYPGIIHDPWTQDKKTSFGI